MTWVVTYQLERDQPLGDDERAALAAHLTEHGDGWTVAQYGLELAAEGSILAHGTTTVPLDFVHPDPERLLTALTALRAVVSGATCAVSDTHALIGWDPYAERYALNAGIVPAPPLGLFETEPPRDTNLDADPFFAPVAAPEPAHTEGVVIAAANTSDLDPELVERIRALDEHPDPYTEKRSIETRAPVEVARTVLSILRELDPHHDARGLLRWALEDLADRTPVRDDMLALWAEPAPHRKWWRTVARVLEPAASDPVLLAATVEIALDDSADPERRRAACELLGNAKSCWPDALATLVALLRRDRDRTRDDAIWRESAIESLGMLGRPEAVPTLVLELAAETCVGWYRPLQALARAGGGAALPWLRRVFSCPGAAEYVIDTLEGIPDALSWLRELAADPEPRFRMLVSRYLGRRGDAELPLVAAIWKSLDEIRYERSSVFREEALEKLGAESCETPDGWDALVKERGLQPVELPAIGDALEALVAFDDRRTFMLERLGQRPDPSLLAAVVLALDLDTALGARGYRTTRSPEWKAWAKVVRRFPFGDRYSFNSKMTTWLRDNLDTLPEQRMTRALRTILRDGSAAIAAGAPEPRLALTRAEMITLDAGERALIAEWDERLGREPEPAKRPTARHDPRVLPRDASELFGSPLEPAPERGTPEPRDSPLAPEPGSEESEVLRFAPGTTEVELDLSDPTFSRLTLMGVLENRLPRPVQLVAVDFVLRGAEGRLGDVGRRLRNEQFWHHVSLDELMAFGGGAIDAAEAVDIFVTHEVGFCARLVAADLEPHEGKAPELRTAWPYDLHEVEPGYPLFDVRLALFKPRADYMRCSYVVELSQRTPLRAASQLDLLVAVRNRGGSIVAQETTKVTAEGGGPTYIDGQLFLNLAEMRTARRFEVAVSGKTRRTERVAAFALKDVTPQR